MNDIFVENSAAVERTLLGLLSVESRDRIVRALAKTAVDVSKDKIKEQKDVMNVAWIPRKNKQKRRKMLVKLGKRLMVVSADSNSAYVGFKNTGVGKVAYKQQEGIGNTVTMQSVLNNRRVRKPLTDPATKIQAQALLDVGFMVRKANSGFKTPTKKWISDNMTISEAGFILRTLRGKALTAWFVRLPARSFLGINPNELADFMNAAAKEFLRKVHG